MQDSISKNYVRRRLLYGLQAGILQDNFKLHEPKSIENIILSNKKGVVGYILRKGFEHKNIIKAIPIVRTLALKIKDKLASKKERIDLSGLLAPLPVNEFVQQLYVKTLSRTAEDSDIISYDNLLKNGFPKEAIIYIIYISPEFAGRAQIKNIKYYKLIYNRYKVKIALKNLTIVKFILERIR